LIEYGSHDDTDVDVAWIFVCQSLVHVCHVQTNRFVAVRFTFYFVQLVCFLALMVIAAWYAASSTT